MPIVYQVAATENVGDISDSFANAIIRLATARYPGINLHATFSDGFEFHELLLAGANGSFLQRLRYEISLTQEKLEIVRHDTSAPARKMTAQAKFDLKEDGDPAYAVQDALWHMAKWGGDVNQAGFKLEMKLGDAYSHRHFGQNAAGVVDHLREMEMEMGGGPSLIPEEGSPEDILRSLPGIARAEFERKAALAFLRNPQVVSLEDANRFLAPCGLASMTDGTTLNAHGTLVPDDDAPVFEVKSDVEDMIFRCRLAGNYKTGLLPLVFETRDIRDVMAFIIRERNLYSARDGDMSGIADDDKFVVNHVEIHDFFADYDDFGDIKVLKIESDGALVIALPEVLHGSAYVDWRDARAVQMLAEPATGPTI